LYLYQSITVRQNTVDYQKGEESMFVQSRNAVLWLDGLLSHLTIQAWHYHDKTMHCLVIVS